MATISFSTVMTQVWFTNVQAMVPRLVAHKPLGDVVKAQILVLTGMGLIFITLIARVQQMAHSIIGEER